MALRNVDEARNLATEGVRRHPYDPQAHLLAGRTAMLQRDDGDAMHSLERALNLLDMSRPSYAPAGFVQPGASAASLPEGDPRRTAFESASDTELRSRILAEMQLIQDRHRPAAVLEGQGRLRNGEVGFSALYELRQSLHVESPIGYSGRGAIHISEVELDAANVARNAFSRFGTGAPPPGVAGPDAQRTMGTELRLSYESRHIVADLGTTPLGFPVLAIIGGLGLRDTFGPVSVSLEGGTRSVTDSLLSYAGTKDPRTGLNWGGVVMRGGRLQLGLSTSPVDLFAYGEYHRLVGVRVADNARAAGGGGIEWKLYQGSLGDLRIGPTVSLLWYERNLSFFTMGHGGYFSPQSFVHAGFALRWYGGETLRWDIAAEPGFDSFREDSAPVFPIPVPGVTGTAPAPYGAVSNSGASFNGHAFLGWGISRSVELGLGANVQQAPEFQEFRGGLFLRFGGRPNG
jgi:hypothetical protein